MKVFILSCVLFASLSLSLAFECGLEGTASRIYKGTKVRAHKYPWLAHIRTFKDRKAGRYGQCGGSLVDETHIITAAHCVVKNKVTSKPEDIDVYLGKVKAFSESSTPLKVVHVKIDGTYNDKNLAADFAILTLAKPVKFSNKIAPICLPKSENGIYNMTVSGWGTTGPTDSSSDDLLEVDVQYLTPEQCVQLKTQFFKSLGYSVQPGSIVVQGTHMCAINKKTVGDACAGDSGGPLMHKNSEGRWVLMGVVSGAWTDCGATKYIAGLYTRVHIYDQALQKLVPNAVRVDL